MRTALYVLLLLLLFIEGLITTAPLVFVTLMVFFICTKKEIVFLFAFIAGILLDALLVLPLGLHSLFFVVFLLFVILYERKFEIQTIPFVLLSASIGSFCYVIAFDNNSLLLQMYEVCAGTVFAIVLFFIFRTFTKNPHPHASHGGVHI